MAFSIQQKNIIIDTLEQTATSLHKLELKITQRRDEFVKNYGEKIDDTYKDLKELSIVELKTKLITLGKISCEIQCMMQGINNVIEKTDKEIINKRIVKR